MSDLFPIQDPTLVFALVAALILLAPYLMGRWRLPGMIGLLLAGALLGPNAFGVLARDQSFVLFGNVGLLYIMFSAALEIDMALLRRYGAHSVVFGLLTFAIPQGLGVVVAHYLLGFDWPAAILLASMFASHTLLAYPIASRLGIARNRAVTAAIGGTILTDTLALLVLAAIASSVRGNMDDTFWYRLGVGLLLYVGLILVGLPRLGRWFFRNAGRDGVSEFVFVLATVFGCASLAHVAGAEPIVGAFLAGIALNRLIPHNSTLMSRIRFTGEAVFVPFFLLSVGMLLDYRVFFASFHGWAVAVGMVATVVLTKWLAAESTRLLLGYSRDQARVVFGLSVAQAAATLAATVVGFEIGLFDDAVVNGAVMMIIVTAMLAPWLVDRHGRNLALQTEPVEELPASTQRILVGLPEGRPAGPLLELALMVRDPASREPIYPLRVLEEGRDTAANIAAAEKALDEAAAQIAAADVAAQPVVRIDLNLPSGILRARRELRGTDVIMGWSGRTAGPALLFGTVVEKLLEDREYTLQVARFVAPLNTCRRVLLALPPYADHDPGFPIAASAIKRFANQVGGDLVVLLERRSEETVRGRLNALKPVGAARTKPLERWAGLMDAVASDVGPDDLLVLYGARPGSLAWRSSMGSLPARLAERFPQSNLLIVYPAEPPPDANPAETLRASRALA